MAAELVAVSGRLAGTRFELKEEEIEIGRSPSAAVTLQEEEAGWRHCVIRRENGRFHLIDLQTADGTFLNGIRISSQWLQNGDQISVGNTILAFREVKAAPAVSARVTLLRACSLLFLFRALAESSSAAQSDLLEQNILSLIHELAPFRSADALICGTEEELRLQAAERDIRLTSASFVDTVEGVVSVPVYAAGVRRGAIVARFPDAENLDENLEILGAVSTLAATALENIREVEQLRTENARLQEQLTADDFGIVGRSASMKRLLQLAMRVAAQDTTVLILGESGTGKELIARAVHQGSRRRTKPFMAINCAALTEPLLESELFGHEKGAFTGAVAQKKGKLEAAEGGTVFLDEIGELAPALQAKLLRVLQQREFERVGSTKTLPLDVRIVAATNRDLAAEVRRGRFREDLYHRLNVVALTMPALRDRPEDVPLLAEHFLRKSARRIGRPMAGITPEAERLLIRYAWPGNVRELENAMERGVVLSDTEWLSPADLPDVIRGDHEAAGTDLKTTYESAVGGAKRDAILRAWDEAGGDYRKAAELLGIHPNSLLRLIRRHGLRGTLKRSAAT